MATPSLHLSSSKREITPPPKPSAKPPLAGARAMSNVIVVKISGKLFADEARLSSLADDIKAVVGKGSKVIIVHGGGKQIDLALDEAGIKTTVRDGVRITPPKAMPIISDVMEGINQAIAEKVRACLKGEGGRVSEAGVPGAPSVVNGAPNPVHPDSCTGTVGEVNLPILQHLLGKSDVIVLSCLAMVGDPNDDYGYLNVNADDVARAAAIALGAKKLIVLSDKPVLGRDGKPLPSLDHASASSLICEKVISDGMVVKVHHMLKAAGTVDEVVVAGEGPTLGDLLEGKYEGATRFLSCGPD
jgi:acetylglutamate kinase